MSKFINQLILNTPINLNVHILLFGDKSLSFDNNKTISDPF